MFDKINLFGAKLQMGELSITGIKTIKIKNKNKIINNKLISINNHAPTTQLNY